MQLLHMLRLLSPSQQRACTGYYVIISSTHFPKKIGLGRSADFLHSGTGYTENSRVRSMIDCFADFSQIFSELALLVVKNSITISITKIGVVEPVTLIKSRVCSMQIPVTISITIFCTVEHPFYGHLTAFNI